MELDQRFLNEFWDIVDYLQENNNKKEEDIFKSILLEERNNINTNIGVLHV